MLVDLDLGVNGRAVYAAELEKSDIRCSLVLRQREVVGIIRDFCVSGEEQQVG